MTFGKSNLFMRTGGRVCDFYFRTELSCVDKSVKVLCDFFHPNIHEEFKDHLKAPEHSRRSSRL